MQGANRSNSFQLLRGFATQQIALTADGCDARGYAGGPSYKGWIYGRERDRQWTQKLGRRSYRFQNPLRQNYKHVKTLQDLLDLSPETIHSVIAFVGDCQLKTAMPPDVVRGGRFVNYIRSFKEPVLPNEEVGRVIEQIEVARMAPGRATNREHVRQLRQRHSTAALRSKSRK